MIEPTKETDMDKDKQRIVYSIFIAIMLALTYLEFQGDINIPYFWPVVPILVLSGTVLYLKGQDFEFSRGQVSLLAGILLLIVGVQLVYHYVLDESMAQQPIMKIAFGLVLLILEIWSFAADKH